MSIDYIVAKEDYDEYMEIIKNQKQEIERLKEENEFLKLNNPEMNIEHFRVVEENKRKINNLRKELKQAKEIALNEHKYASEMEDKYIEANNVIKEVREKLNKIDSATYQGDTDKKTYYKYEKTRIQKLLEILDKENKQ